MALFLDAGSFIVTCMFEKLLFHYHWNRRSLTSV